MNRKIIAVMGPAFLIALISANGRAAGKEAKGGKGRESGATARRLLGSWECRGQNGQTGAVSLVFKTNDTLIFNGDAASYTLAPGAIRVLNESSGRRGSTPHVDYQYKLSGNSLHVVFPDKSALQCKRASRPSSQNASAKGEKMIFGTFCSWSGSSGGGSSYSSTGRAAFDGKGSFNYGSESSFSNKSGMGYGQNAGAGNRGTYKVNGKTIQLSFSDGTTANAQVHFRYPDGSVSEIMYGKTLYGKALCQ